LQVNKHLIKLHEARTANHTCGTCKLFLSPTALLA
jgi:hypothetical protein